MVKSELSIDTLVSEVLRGEFDSFRLILEDIKSEAFSYFMKKLNMCGISVNRPINSLLLHTYIFSVLDSMSWRFKLNGEKLARELHKFIENIGDIDYEIDAYTQEELVDSAIEYTDFLSKLEDRMREKLVYSICILSTAILKRRELEDREMLIEVSKRLVNAAAKELNDKLFQEKSYSIGKLAILSRRIHSPGDLAELLRIIVLSLPYSNQRISNLTTFYLVRILGFFKETIPFLHVPIDPYLSIVVNRLELLKCELPSSLSYLSKTYRRVQRAFRVILPEDTVSIYSLRYIQETICSIKDPKCHICPLISCCSHYSTI